MLAPHRQAKRASELAMVRFETAPGHQMQIDVGDPSDKPIMLGRKSWLPANASAGAMLLVHDAIMKLSILVVTASLAASACADAPDFELDPSLAVDVTALSCAPHPGVCTPVDYPVERYTTHGQLDIRLAGAWRSCGTAEGRGPHDPNLFGAGIELTPEGEVYVLVAAADGACARSTAAPTADWFTFDISEQNADGTYQLALIWRDHGGSSGLVPAFSSSASAMLDRFSGFEFERLRP